VKHALVVGLGPTEIILILLVTLIPLALLALFIIGIVRLFVPRRPRGDQTWPLPGNPSPFQVHQAIGVRLQSVGVTPWGIQVDRPARNVTVELLTPASPHLDDEIRKRLAPLNVEVVWYEASFEQVSRSPEGENPG
jgi:hypothetical protein